MGPHPHALYALRATPFGLAAATRQPNVWCAWGHAHAPDTCFARRPLGLPPLRGGPVFDAHGAPSPCGIRASRDALWACRRDAAAWRLVRMGPVLMRRSAPPRAVLWACRRCAAALRLVRITTMRCTRQAAAVRARTTSPVPASPAPPPRNAPRPSPVALTASASADSRARRGIHRKRRSRSNTTAARCLRAAGPAGAARRRWRVPRTRARQSSAPAAGREPS